MTNGLRISLFLIIVTTCSPVAFAQDSYEKAPTSYSQAAETMTAMVKQIHELYAGKPAFLTKFDASQKAWEEYRRLHIEALYPGGRSSYGSSYNNCAPLESLRLAKERINIINQWITGTIEGDVCGGTVRWVTEEEYVRATGQTLE
ncbi:lysozyme inhibitor LprI family protein [uncultured Pseudodesulfovibrio sp.]|uniref:lysozyme inhibitor LprI family protein n=1 Tax=uncultured Pseudodesulfovibrio sp. TaxID=2035858 RepID=UPI0029C60455|nr:lysozyme inhibitor LprI family protein [uncultured Pseudodesulfovibrio sp.]